MAQHKERAVYGLETEQSVIYLAVFQKDDSEAVASGGIYPYAAAFIISRRIYGKNF
ncbi:hypothetical protein C806_03139 [Lachnospiraceae bacterium 3-1]|nr:hypothetical protein C806_03139 [Lachnospiraceae bacterium 3-1]